MPHLNFEWVQVRSAGFTLKAIRISVRVKDHLVPRKMQFSRTDWRALAPFPTPGCNHHPTIVAGHKPKYAPDLKWINAILGNLKTSLPGCYHAFDFRKYDVRNFAAFLYRFNRSCDQCSLDRRHLTVAAGSVPQRLRSVRLADVYCYLG